MEDMNELFNEKLEKKLKEVMAQKDFYKFTFIDENDKEIEYEIVLTFKSKSRKKIYYVLTDKTTNENNELNVTVYYIDYDEDYMMMDDDTTFHPVVDDEELSMVYDVLHKLQGN